MQLFYISALAAAETSAAAFQDEFKKPDANANISEYKYCGDSLIEAIIKSKKISDNALPPLLECLIAHQVNLNKNDMTAETPLVLAARYARREAVKYLAGQGVEGGEHALCVAASAFLRGDNCKAEDYVDIVKFLVEEHKVNVNFKDQFQYTPLIRAVTEGQVKIVEYLLEKGADLTISVKGQNSEMTALSFAHYKRKSYSLALFFDPNVSALQERKMCFSLLEKAASDFLYARALSYVGSPKGLIPYLNSYLEKMVGDFEKAEKQPTHGHLKHELNLQALKPALERFHARGKAPSFVAVASSSPSMSFKPA